MPGCNFILSVVSHGARVCRTDFNNGRSFTTFHWFDPWACLVNHCDHLQACLVMHLNT
jgi:hypothetical protein